MLSVFESSLSSDCKINVAYVILRSLLHYAIEHSEYLDESYIEVLVSTRVSGQLFASSRGDKLFDVEERFNFGCQFIQLLDRIISDDYVEGKLQNKLINYREEFKEASKVAFNEIKIKNPPLSWVWSQLKFKLREKESDGELGEELMARVKRIYDVNP